ncbi:Leucine-rich repeat-containing protein 57 [Polyrhizophydium stewartii]|uniref:Leucine-rich repeat-containing protein 57 n=1 Tax=Polyrhizophydium stewartii TaxID=2732419 RepID=A0ABR4ND38_9FUNG
MGPLLTLVYMYEHDGLTKHADESIGILTRLGDIDPLRRDYYMDLRSRFVWAKHVEAGLEPAVRKTATGLCDLGLTQVPDAVPLAFTATVDLSRNGLRDMAFVASLVLVQELVLDDNQITHVPDEIAAMGRLRTLSLRRNRIASAQAAAAVKSLRSLRTLDLAGNPLPAEDMKLTASWLRAE